MKHDETMINYPNLNFWPFEIPCGLPRDPAGQIVSADSIRAYHVTIKTYMGKQFRNDWLYEVVCTCKAYKCKNI